MPIENISERKAENRFLENEEELDAFDLETDLSEDSDGEIYGSSSYQKHSSKEFASSLGSLDAAGAVKKLELLKKDPSLHLSVEDKKKISILINQLKKITGKIPASLLNELKAFEAKIFGNMSLETEEFPEESDSDAAYLKADLDKTKKMIEDNSNLTKEEKEAFLKNIEKWSHSLDLGRLDLGLIQEQLDAMREELNQVEAFPKNLREMSKQTGKEPSELQALLKKHNLDSENLPNPPDEKVAALLNDPEFSEKLDSLKSDVSTAQTALSDEIKKQTEAAKHLNDEAKKDKNKARSSDVSSYEFLYKAHFHKDEKSKALIAAQLQLATETASCLSALYGKTVTAETSPEKVGVLSFEGGASINVLVCGAGVEASASGVLQFSNKASIDWPKVEVVPFAVDNFRDGKTEIPEWMTKSNYPLDVYDQYNPDQDAKDDWWKWLLVPIAGPLAFSDNFDDELHKSDALSTGGELKDIN